MAAAGLPLLKLSTLLVKAIAKPLASGIKNEAKKYPTIDYVCVSAGNLVHYCYARINVAAMGYKFVGVKPLPHDQALSDGVSFLAEAFVIGFSAAVVVIDYRRSAAKSALSAAKLKEEKKREKDEIADALRAIHQRLDKIENNQSKQNKDETTEGKKQSGWLW
jgi:optic atrophy 3 protein